MVRTGVFCTVLFCLTLSAQVFPAGDPVMASNRGGGLSPMTPADYQKFAADVAGHANTKVIRKLPPNLSPDYRLGYNFVYESANHGWILDRDSDGYKIYLDLNDNGDLSRAEPYRFHEESGVLRIELPMKDSVAHWTTRFELHQPEGGLNNVTVGINSFASRSGTILLNGREIPFRLSLSSGRVNAVGTGVSFDREGNGKYESYRVTDRWVNLAGETYEFHVDPLGASVTLKETDSLPDRPSLRNGSPIPDVSLTDLEDKPHAFRHNSADVTLLEFWDTHCGPCREETPQLKVLYDKLPRARFDILGVSDDQSEEDLRKYLAGFSIAWPECREAETGPVHRLMRIEGIPAYFLLSKDGEILDQWVGSGHTISKIEAALK